ncbi:MAG TPA: nitrite/sulfite reductase [bacterium]|nr:nitrite/sulfite reductase [bacterium]
MTDDTLLVPEGPWQAFQDGVAAVAAGRLEDEAFKPARLGVGAHRQRGGSGYMVRVRVPGGRLSLAQWMAAAEVARDLSASQRVHLTLRQDLQIYDVALPSLAVAVGALRERGLSTYSSGGSSVRNITAGVLADLEEGLPFDAYPYAAALSARLSRGALFNGLPRKFKIGFAGPLHEQAQAWFNDLGFVPRLLDGRRGFRVLGGGGLGASPQSAAELEDFLPATRLAAYAEAALEYFNAVSPRDQPLVNRFKFVIRRQGLDRVRAEIRARAQGRPDLAEPDSGALGAAGACLWVAAPQGDLSAAQMGELGALLEGAGAHGLRISLDQRILAPGVDPAAAAAALAPIQALGLGAALQRPPARRVVCAGPDTCNRGLVNSKALGKALDAAGVELPVSLHISGCQNGCSQHLIAPLSLQGVVQSGPKGRRPAYLLRSGLGVQSHGLGFGGLLATIPARRVPGALAALLAAWKKDPGGLVFDAWLRSKGLAGLAPILAGVPVDVEGEAKDWGSEEPFHVALEGSECH